MCDTGISTQPSPSDKPRNTLYWIYISVASHMRPLSITLYPKGKFTVTNYMIYNIFFCSAKMLPAITNKTLFIRNALRLTVSPS